MIGRVRSVPAIGALKTYSLWVCPVKMAATFGEVWVAILAKAPPAAISFSRVAPSGVPSEAPSWIDSMMTSASPLLGSPSVSWPATRFTASVGSPKSSPAVPAGLTRLFVSWVIAPITATRRPPLVKMA